MARASSHAARATNHGQRATGHGPRITHHVSRFTFDASVLALFAALSLVMTWPLALRLSSAVLGPPGDNLEYVWKLWWFKRALVELGQSPFWAPDVFAPFGYPVALSETTLAHTILGLPLTMAVGEVASYNLLILASFVLSGWATYRLVREWTGDGWAGLVAGAVFAFSPYRLAHLGAGHLPLMGTQWLPLAFLSADRLVRKRSWGAAVGLGVSYALLALSSWYYAYLGALFLGVFVVWRAWRHGKAGGESGTLFRRLQVGLWEPTAGRRSASTTGPVYLADEQQPHTAGRSAPERPEWRLGQSPFLLAAAIAVILILPAAWPLLRAARQGATAYSFSLRFIDQWSASPLDFFLPSGLHPLWGGAILPASGQNVHETLIGLGWVPLGLAVYAWVQRRRLPGAPVGLLAALAIIAFVLALGTTLHWCGRPVYVPLPKALVDLFNRCMSFLTGRLALNRAPYYSMQQEYAIVVPLPTLLLYLFLPFFNGMRVWARFGLITNLAVAALAGMGVAAMRGARQRQRIVPALLLVLVCFEFLAAPYPLGWTEVRGQPVDEWLAGQPRGLVAEFPLERTWYGPPLYAQRVHGQPIAYGYGTFAPPEYQAARRRLESFPADDTLNLLRSWRVRYLVVGQGSYGERWPEVMQALESQPDLRRVWEGDDLPRYHGDRLIHRLPPDPAVPATELVSGELRPFMDDHIVVFEFVK